MPQRQATEMRTICGPMPVIKALSTSSNTTASASISASATPSDMAPPVASGESSGTAGFAISAANRPHECDPIGRASSAPNIMAVE